MAKIFTPPSHSTLIPKRRISLWIPKKMADDLLETMKKEKMSNKLQSQWISRAIMELERCPEYWNKVAEEWLASGDNVKKTISLDKNASAALDRIGSTIRKEMPNVEDIQSRIIRTAIIQSIIHRSYGVEEIIME